MEKNICTDILTDYLDECVIGVLSQDENGEVPAALCIVRERISNSFMRLDTALYNCGVTLEVKHDFNTGEIVSIVATPYGRGAGRR